MNTTMDDVAKLSNVTLASVFKDKFQGKQILYRADDILVEVLWKVAVDNPHWSFVIQRASLRSDDSLHVDTVRVFQDGEKLGDIASEYYRHKYAVFVSCKKLRNILDRGDTRRTTKPNVAISTIKKFFTKQTVQENLEAAWHKANSEVSNIEYRSRNATQEVLGKLKPALMRYVFDERLEDYRSYLNSQGEEHLLNKYIDTKENYEVIKDITDKFKSGASCLVMLNDGIYTVQFKGKPPEAFNDQTLPEDYRGKIGLLKLVVDGHMVSGVGCRISANIFALVFD